jgi:hypothetical protein
MLLVIVSILYKKKIYYCVMLWVFDILYVYVPHIVHIQRSLYTTKIQFYNNLATRISQDSSKELVLEEIESKLNLIWKKLYLYWFILYDGQLQRKLMSES